MNELKGRILNCKTPDELNSMRLLIVKDIVNFVENQKAFKRVMGRLKSTPIEKRPEKWGKYYNSLIEQQTE